MAATTDRELHVALVFDQYFWAPAYATMRAICLHTHRRGDLRFQLCHPALSARTMADLGRIGEEFGAVLIHHDTGHDADYRYFADRLPHTDYITEVAYARMVLPQILDPAIKRVAYIDCDILIRAPIEELLGEDLKGQPLGAVKEPLALVDSNGRDGMKRRELFDPADPYFNSGLLLMDLDAWRGLDIVGLLRGLEADGTLKLLTTDQLILNYLFKNKWTQIDRSWNTQAASNPMLEALDPKGVHYTGLHKPWNLITYLPYRRLYRHIMTNDFFYRYMRERVARTWRRRLNRLIGRPSR